MPLRTIGKEVTRGTVCKDTFRAGVIVACSDRIPAGAASHLYLNIRWRERRDGGDVPGRPDDAQLITLTLRKLTAAASGDIRFDAQGGPTTKGFSRDVDQFLVIFGESATSGATPDVGLDVTIEGELQTTINLSVGPAATTVAIRAENGVDEAGFFVLPDAETRLTAVATPATPGLFGWISGSADLLLASPVTTPTVSLTARRPTGATPPVVDRALRLAVLFTPDSGAGAVMAVHELFPIYNPEEPGPFPVGRAHYPNTAFAPPDMTLLAGLDGWPLDIVVPIEALIRYPAQSAGDDTPFATRRANYPLIILAHGRNLPVTVELMPDGDFRFDSADNLIPVRNAAGEMVEFKNFEGLDYLASHLASYGFIAVSVNLNGRFDPATGNGELYAPQGAAPTTCHPLVIDQVAITQRGLVVLEHIRKLRELNVNDPIFQDKVDLNNVGLLGHSRGGEAVVSAHDSNKFLVPFGLDEKIKGVVSIAPSNSRDIHPELPYLVIFGTDDGDLFDLEGLPLYDRAQPPKQIIIVVGGIHNYFSSNWERAQEVPAEPPVSRPQHVAIAKGYCNIFFQRYINGVSGDAPYFTGQRRLDLPASVELHFAYQAPNGLLVDTFEDAPADTSRNTLDRAVATSNVASFDELLLSFVNPDCSAGAAGPTWFHDTHGLMLTWSSLAASYTNSLSDPTAEPDGRSVQAFAALSFRVAQDSGTNPPGATQDFKVRLTDKSGEMATLKVSDFGLIPAVRAKTIFNPTVFTRPRPTATVRMSILKTIRIPLHRFKQENADLKLETLASVSFLFNEQAPGKLAFDDIEFSR